MTNFVEIAHLCTLRRVLLQPVWMGPKAFVRWLETDSGKTAEALPMLAPGGVSG